MSESRRKSEEILGLYRRKKIKNPELLKPEPEYSTTIKDDKTMILEVAIWI